MALFQFYRNFQLRFLNQLNNVINSESKMDSHIPATATPMDHPPPSSEIKVMAGYRSLLASLSDSRRVRISPSLTGPFTLRMIERFVSSMNSTRTWVHCP